MGPKLKFSEWGIGLALSLFFLFMVLTGIFDITGAIEQKCLDFGNRITASVDRHPDIELVVITDNDISEIGPYPWPSHILTQCINKLSVAGAKVIALDMILDDARADPGIKAIRHLLQSYERSGLPQQRAGLTFYKELSEALANLENDAKLCKAIERAGNVVLPIQFNPQGTHRDSRISDFVSRHSLKNVRESEKKDLESAAKWVSSFRPVLPDFAEAASAMGHVNFFPDSDGYVRYASHVLGYLQEIYFPSFALAIVKVFNDLRIEDISVVLGESISLRKRPSFVSNIPVFPPQMRTLIRWSEGPAVAFHQTPFNKVLKNQVEAGLFKNKIVIIGTTASGPDDRFVTPVSPNLPGVELVANSVANIINQNFIFRPLWFSRLELAALVVFGLFITFILPRLNASNGALTTLGLMMVYGGIGTILFFSSSLWLKFVSPLLLLVFGYSLLFSKHLISTEKSKATQPATFPKLNKTSIAPPQGQVMLDLALDRLTQLPNGNDKIKDFVYDLGLVYEQNQEFSRALALYELVLETDSNFRDLNDRILKLRAPTPFATGASEVDHLGRSELIRRNNGQQLAFRRYKLIGELGRGRRGLVYKARHVHTQEIVAIKVLDFSEFDGDHATEIKNRFLRAAESAALLRHPNIATIHDFGEEKKYGYLAMEYLKGLNLGRYTRPNQLLPLRETLNAVVQIADALDYAHGKGVLHGDITPSSIFRMRKTKALKIINFAVERITPASKSGKNPGVNAPYYMSPEQLSGKKLDGRSDIFSVGVLLFELLTGKKPFTGDDIGALMLMIAKDTHPSAKALNERVPRVVEKIIDRALEKDPDRRYQTAGQMAAQLKEVIAKIDKILAQKVTVSHVQHV